MLLILLLIVLIGGLIALIRSLIAQLDTCTDDLVVKNHVGACTSTDDLIVKNHVDACISTDDLIVKNQVDTCTSTDDLIVKNQVDTCTSTDDLIVKNQVDTCTSTNDLIVKNQIDSCTSTDDLIFKNHVDACTEIDMPINNKPCDNESCDNDNDNRKLQVTNNVNDENKDVNKEHKTKNKSIKPKKEALIHKKNKLVDQVHLIAKIRSDYLKNINEISEIMNDLHDDPQLRHIELNKINVLVDKSLNFATELCHGGNREWYDQIDNINTINDKIDLFNEIGEVIDSYMTDAYNIIDATNKSHNNDSLYDTLAEGLKKCKDIILKMIIGSNICVKQDTKKNDTDNVNLREKQDPNKNEASIIENDIDNDSEADDDNDSEADDDNARDDDDDNDSGADDDRVIKDFPNLSDKTINNLIIIGKIRKEILNNNSEIK